MLAIEEWQVVEWSALRTGVRWARVRFRPLSHISSCRFELNFNLRLSVVFEFTIKTINGDWWSNSILIDLFILIFWFISDTCQFTRDIFQKLQFQLFVMSGIYTVENYSFSEVLTWWEMEVRRAWRLTADKDFTLECRM